MLQTRLHANFAVPTEHIADFCRRHYIRKFAFFGSVLRDDFHPASDIDVLVEFVPGHVPGYIRLTGMAEELEALFGRVVDLKTPNSLSHYFRQRVLDEAEVVYVHE